MAFQRFPPAPLNIVTDSAYVADVTQRSDQALLEEVDNVQLFGLLKTLWHTIQARNRPYTSFTLEATLIFQVLFQRATHEQIT